MIVSVIISPFPLFTHHLHQFTFDYIPLRGFILVSEKTYKMNKSYLYLLTCILFFLAAIINCSTQSSAQTKIEKINELVSKYVEYGKFSGSALVAEKGEVIYKNGFGKANIEWDIPNQPDTKFRLASVTKQFIAMLVMQ